jgi:formate dehydrogenase major subunit
MELARRTFLKAGALGGLGLSAFGFDLTPAYGQLRELKIARTTETRSTCPYCAVSCGVIIHTVGDSAKNVTGPTVAHVEGDPDHPINRGTLCPKGIALKEDIVNDHRLTKPLYRAPGAKEWKEISWDDAIERIATNIKKTRDKTFRDKDEQGRVINQNPAIAMIGGCTDTNEFNYLYVKALRSLGVVYTDNQARI